MSAAWVTLAEAKAALNISSSTADAELQSFIDTACQAIDRQFGPIGPETRTEVLDGWSTTVLLRRAPIVSVTSVTEYAGTTGTLLANEPLDGGSFTDYGYRVDTSAGILTRMSSDGGRARFRGDVVVVYVAGYSPIPDDAKRGALELVRHLWETQRGRSQNAPGYDSETGEAASTSFAFPNRVIELLQPFRMPRLP